MYCFYEHCTEQQQQYSIALHCLFRVQRCGLCGARSSNEDSRKVSPQAQARGHPSRLSSAVIHLRHHLLLPARRTTRSGSRSTRLPYQSPRRRGPKSPLQWPRILVDLETLAPRRPHLWPPTCRRVLFSCNSYNLM